MLQYITQLEDKYYLGMSMLNIKEKFENAMPADLSTHTYNFSYHVNSCNNAFLSMMHQMDRILYDEHFITDNLLSSSYYKTEYWKEALDLMLRGGYSEKVTGIVIIEAPRTHYEEKEKYTHLEAVETSLKIDSHHFLKVFVINNILIAFTNKPLPFETVIKLKMLQWSITASNMLYDIPEIKQFPQAFLDKDINKINELVDKIFTCERMHNLKYDQLKKIFKPNYRRRILKIQEKLNVQNNDYDYHEEALRKVAIRINELQTELDALKYLTEKEPEDDNPLIKYLSNHPYIKDISKISNTTVELHYEAPIIYFDEFLIEKILPNWSGPSHAILKAFIDNKYELMVQCKVRFNTESFRVDSEYMGSSIYFGHPHIDKHGCFGNHGTAIAEAAKSMNYLGAIEQISEGVLNLNFSDGIVIRQMLRDLTSDAFYHTLDTWRSKETGELLTTEQLVEVYK